MSFHQSIALSRNIALLPTLGLVVTLDRLNLEGAGQTVTLYRSPADVSELTQLEADHSRGPELAGLFDHLSGFKNRLLDFHLHYELSERSLVFSLSERTSKLVTDLLQRVLGIARHDATVRLNAAISGLAKLSALDDMARFLKKNSIQFRISAADDIVIERAVAA